MLKALGKAIIYIIKKKNPKKDGSDSTPPPIGGTCVPIGNPIRKSKNTF